METLCVADCVLSVTVELNREVSATDEELIVDIENITVDEVIPKEGDDNSDIEEYKVDDFSDEVTFTESFITLEAVDINSDVVGDETVEFIEVEYITNDDDGVGVTIGNPKSSKKFIKHYECLSYNIKQS